MPCDAATLETDACSNGLLQVANDEVLYRTVELQLLYTLAGSSDSVATILANACTNGLEQVAQNEQLYRALKLQLLCQISGG
jgi:hypothetical protein